MNILQLSKYYPPQWGGIELVANMLSRAHVELGDRVSVVAFDQFEKKELGDFGETIIRIKEDLFFSSTPISFSFHKRFFRLIKDLKVERIYVHLPNPYMHQLLCFFSSYLKKESIEIVAIYHSDLVNQKKLGPYYEWYFLETAGIYDLFVTSTYKLYESSSVLQRLPKEKMRFIPFCTASKRSSHLRRDFSGKLISIGRLVSYKGYEFLFNAIKGQPYELTVVGDGPLRRTLEAIKPPNVVMLGTQSETEKFKLMRQSDLLIVSSINRAEAYGMTIVEAFEDGLPVVAANIDSGVTFLVRSGYTGEVFDIGNMRQFRKSLHKFFQTPELLPQYSKNCRSFFEENLSFEQFKRHFKDLKT